MHSFRVLGLISAVSISLFIARAQTPAAEPVRQAFYDLNGEAPELAERLALEHPDDVALQHWRLALSRPQLIIEPYRQANASDPKGAWTLVARARYASPWERGILFDEAIAAAPNDVDILVVATREMQKTLSEGNDKEQTMAFRGKVSSFLAEHESAYDKSAHGLSARAAAEQALSTGKDAIATASVATATTLAARSLALDPKDIQATIVKAAMLHEMGDQTSSYEVLRARVMTGSNSNALYQAYVTSTFANPKLSASERNKAILAATHAALDYGMPGRSFVVGLLYETQAAGVDTTAAIEDMIAKRYPGSVASDTVLLMQATMDDPLIASDPNSPAKMVALEQYLDTPTHPSQTNLDRARSQLISIMAKQDKPDLDRLYKELMTPHEEDYGDSPAVATLAEHKVHLADLERLARKRLNEQIALVPDRMLDQSDKQGFAFFAMGYFLTPWQSVLGLIYFEEGRLDESLQALLSAQAMSPNGLTTTIRLGNVYDAQGNYAAAQKEYEAALTLNMVGPGEHPAVAALRSNYMLQHADGKGVEQYMKGIVEQDIERRRLSVLKERIAAPTGLPPIALKTLDGKSISSADLAGKVIVLNFWATWCGPCREELPDFEKLYAKYRDDPDVIVLSMSIDSADTPIATIGNFIHAHKYSFPVVLGPQYGTDNSITPIPMTWFIAPDGKITYRKIGYTKDLVQEFSWRIESLRGGNVVKASGSK
jgi:thiol-disulfide isomerase/thioredoxin